MMLDEYFKSLEEAIQNTYESGVTILEAERLAAKFLHAQIKISSWLQEADLDARMKKSGLKSIKATLYMKEVKAAEKKPSDTFLENAVIKDVVVQTEQDNLDAAEVRRDRLTHFFNISKEAHIYFRGIAKGRFE